MSHASVPLIRAGDLAAAANLLTRLPIPVDAEAAGRRGAASAWAWPIVGAGVGAAAGAAMFAGTLLGLPTAVCALLAVAVQVLLTGALHEDGLADTADGLWGGWTRDRRLEIMRDSRIGSYGVLALILSVGLRAAALAALPAGLATGAMIASGGGSRALMAALMWRMPGARPDGMSARAGRPPGRTALLALGLAVAIAAAALPGPVALGGMALAGMGAVAMGVLARAKIGGQTGDILGAAQQLAEIGFLLAACALV